MKLKRLDLNKEYELMLPESNINNIETLKRLLDKFFLNKKSIERAERFLSGKLSRDERYLDIYFDLNNQKRAFYDLTISKEEDFAYMDYKNSVSYRFQYCDDLDISSKLKEKILDYSTFKSGKIKINGQVRKLFKFLLSKDLLSKEHIDHLNTIKTKNHKLFLCVSRNPIDYLMIATNQGFTSCVDYDFVPRQGGASCFFLSNIGSIIDPNRFLVFLTDGYIKRYKIKTKEIKHFKYLSRTWGVLFHNTLNDHLVLLKTYPTNVINFKKSLEYFYPSVVEATKPYNTINREDEILSESKFKFEPLEFILKNRFAVPYIDNLASFKDKDTNNITYRFPSCPSNEGEYMDRVHTRFKSTLKFNEMCDIDDAVYNYICETCGDTIHYIDIINRNEGEEITKPKCRYCHSKEPRLRTRFRLNEANEIQFQENEE